MKTPREFRQEQEFDFDHFVELTSTGIKPNYNNIEMFAHDYYKYKLKLLELNNYPDTKEVTRIALDCAKQGKELNQNVSIKDYLFGFIDGFRYLKEKQINQ